MTYNPFRWAAIVVGWVRAALLALLYPEGRRAWAVLIAFGCGVVMAVIAAVGLYLDRHQPGYVFWIATEAMAVNLIVITAFTGLLVKRDIGGTVTLPGGSSGSVTIKDAGADGDDTKS